MTLKKKKKKKKKKVSYDVILNLFIQIQLYVDRMTLKLLI